LIWQTWIRTASEENKTKIHIFIHAKYPERVKSSWARKYLVDFCFCPNWGSVEITKAMIGLLEKVSLYCDYCIQTLYYIYLGCK
jgi:hypothetical protein